MDAEKWLESKEREEELSEQRCRAVDKSLKREEGARVKCKVVAESKKTEEELREQGCRAVA